MSIYSRMETDAMIAMNCTDGRHSRSNNQNATPPRPSLSRPRTQHERPGLALRPPRTTSTYTVRPCSDERNCHLYCCDGRVFKGEYELHYCGRFEEAGTCYEESSGSWLACAWVRPYDGSLLVSASDDVIFSLSSVGM